MVFKFVVTKYNKKFTFKHKFELKKGNKINNWN